MSAHIVTCRVIVDIGTICVFCRERCSDAFLCLVLEEFSVAFFYLPIRKSNVSIPGGGYFICTVVRIMADTPFLTLGTLCGRNDE